jgi:hypothetical protein
MRDLSGVHRVRLGPDQTKGTIPMPVTLTSTKAKVSDPQKVEKILDSYYEEGVAIQLSEEPDGWTLAMTFRDGDIDGYELPVALPRERLPSEEQYPDDEEWNEEVNNRFDEEGAEGFLALLRELAPHLETPLVILWGAELWRDYSAKAWVVQPGASEVEMLDLNLGR